MAMFGRNTPSAGPGPETPRKTGLARLWEVISRDSGIFTMSGLLAGLGVLLFLFGWGIGLFRQDLVVLLFTCALGGTVMGCGICGLTDTVLRSLRDEPGFWWYNWRRAMHRNWKNCLPLGAVSGIAVGGLLCMLLPVIGGSAVLSTLAILGLCALLIIAISIWSWPQIALMELSLPAVLRNTLLMALAYPLRTLGAVVIWFLYLLIMLLYFPISLLLLLATLWFPALCALHCIYKPLSDTFHFEAAITQLAEQRRKETDPADDAGVH